MFNNNLGRKKWVISEYKVYIHGFLWELIRKFSKWESYLSTIARSTEIQKLELSVMMEDYFVMKI